MSIFEVSKVDKKLPQSESFISNNKNQQDHKIIIRNRKNISLSVEQRWRLVQLVKESGIPVKIVA